MDINKWGFVNKTQWMLIEAAPLTASARNEILATAVTKREILIIARALQYKVTATGQYQIVKLPAGKSAVRAQERKETANGADL